MDLTNLNKDRSKTRRKSSFDLSTMVYGKVPPQAKDLEQARKFHEFLDAGRKNLGDLSHILYVAGYGRGAPVAVGM